MAFKKTKKEKKPSPVAALPAREEVTPAVTIARQGAALEKAWKERDAARDQVTLLTGRVGQLKAELVEAHKQIKNLTCPSGK